MHRPKKSSDTDAPAQLLSSPELVSSLLETSSAVSYEDLSRAAERFCQRAVRHTHGEVLLGYVDFRADNAILVRSNFPTKIGRTAEERRFRADLSPVAVFMDLHPETRVYRGRGHTLPPLRELLKSDWHRHVMEPEGWHDFLGMCFRSPKGAVDSSVFVNRAPGLPPFDRREIGLFDQAYPIFQRALRRVHLLADSLATRTDLQHSLLDLPIATVLINWDLKLEHCNRAARSLCNSWLYGLDAARRFKLPATIELPAEILSACEGLRECWRQNPAGGTVLRRVVNHGLYPELQASVTLLRPHAVRLARPSFLVRITEGRRDDIAVGPPEDYLTQLLARLSAAERGLVPHLKRGLDNKAIAGLVGKSVPTVKAQLQSIFRKLGVNSRAELVARLR